MAKLKLKEDRSHKFHRPRGWWAWLALAIVVITAVWVHFDTNRSFSKVDNILPVLTNHKPTPGKVISVEVVRTYTASEVNALARQNYGSDYLPAKNAVTKLLIKYTSLDQNGKEIDEYARVYVPQVAAPAKAPLISLAPGTTGIGDECAASLEEPFRANWANYESHAAAYAGQGYATVITDYEGMRDPTRIHHYMVGELEGRAVLDAARATYALADYKNIDSNQLFLAGYSQGGHAIAFADELAASYAPELKIRGLVDFAPVNNVVQTLADVTRGSNIDWFGPFLLTSYSDFYHQKFALDTILQPKWIPNLTGDVASHCINSVKYWPAAPEQVYTANFIASLKDINLLPANYAQFYQDMLQNQPWQSGTATPKLINQGQKDNVVLPDQQINSLTAICKGTGAVALQPYSDATHYTVMVKSYRDTLAWMQKIITGQPLPNSCQSGLLPALPAPAPAPAAPTGAM